MPSVPFPSRWFGSRALSAGLLILGCVTSASCGAPVEAPAPSPGACVAPQSACGAACVSALSDPNNCGTCGNVCAQGMLCSSGTCKASCLQGMLACGGGCIDPLSSAANCGACNRLCGVGQTCSAGACIGASPAAGGSGGSAGSSVDPSAAGALSTAGTGGVLGSAGTTASGSGSGYLVGTMCFPACASAASDPDPVTGVSDGYGYENNGSCLVSGSAATASAPRCMPLPPKQPTDIPPGNGYYIASVCHPRCASAASDPDPVTGVSDGWGYEKGASCIVVGSAPTVGVPTCVPPAAATGDGYLVSALCVPACTHPELADAQGYGYEAQRSCVVSTSLAAMQNARCMLTARTDLPPAGTGFQNGQTCFPLCSDAAQELTADGYGWDANRTCVVKASKATVQGVPCVPPPNTVTGACPKVLTCPIVAGGTLACGCTWIEGLGQRKQTIMSTNGATQYFVASAMMETAALLANYALGDNKTQDSFNAGLAKQNWGMIRRCHPAWSGQSAAQFATSAAMNTDLALDVQVYNECRVMFGDSWWSGHRAGYGSLGMSTLDIQQFKAASDWTNQMLTDHLTDDVRFWVTIRPI